MPQRKILVTGGAGYIGSRLVPALLADGHQVTVLDSLLFGASSLAACRPYRSFTLVRGDIRDVSLVQSVIRRGRFGLVIHLAAISNDPSSELRPELTLAVNLHCLEPLMRESRDSGVERFLYASSASVYGVRSEPDVTEDLPLEPVTLYARCKADGEAILNSLASFGGMAGVSVRAATVCGVSPRMRLDLTINILTEQAVCEGRLRVFGGPQRRPNIHVDDLVDFYRLLVSADRNAVQGRAFNVCAANATVAELAQMVRSEIAPELPIDFEPTEDLRSYHLDASRAQRELGFEPRRRLAAAVREVAEALRDGRLPNPRAPIYRNVEWLRANPELTAEFATPA